MTPAQQQLALLRNCRRGMTRLVRVHRAGDVPRLHRGLAWYEREERALRAATGYTACVWGNRGCPDVSPILCETCAEKRSQPEEAAAA